MGCRRLVRGLCQRALAGAGATPAEVRSDSLKLSEGDPRRLIEGWGRLSAEVAPRVAPILLLCVTRREPTRWLPTSTPSWTATVWRA
jgi:hypothetical protein